MASGGTTSLLGEGGGFIILASAVLCLYDHAITFSEEARCVWRRRMSGAGVLFILNRYATLVLSLASIAQVTPRSPNLEFGFDAYIPVICRVALRTIDVCLVVMKATYAFFAALRMLALYGMSKPVFATIFALGLLGPGVQILILPFEDPNPQPLVPVPSSANLFGPINCFRARTSQVETSTAFGEVMNMIIPILRAYFFTFEAILIALTTRKILVQRCLRSPIIRTPFISMICCKGTLYFLITEAVTTINLVGIILSLTDPRGPADVVTFLCLTGTLVEAITSICMSRFILDLLAITLDENSDGIRTSQWRTLSFATVVENIADDLGGDLCNSSMDDRGEESVVIRRIPV